METLNIEHISHSIIIEHLINSISILNKSERNLNLNSHLNYKEHLRWLVSTGAWQPEEKDMPNHNPGIYLFSLHFISTTDTVLAQHLASDRRIKYTSKTNMEEQVKLLAREVRNVVISECETAKFYTITGDSSPDISHKNQMAVLLRYVTVDRQKRLVQIQERFIGY